MARRQDYQLLFRLLFNGLQEAESQEEFAKVGYYWLLPIAIVTGIFLTVASPTASFFAAIITLASEYLHLSERILSKFPAPLMAPILIWLVGFCIVSFRNRIGGTSGRLVIAVGDRFASLGERLAERRLLSFALVVIFAVMAFAAYFQYNSILEVQDRRIKLADRWLSELTPAVNNATHSLRDIRAFQRIEPKFSKSEALEITKQMGSQWESLVCLADYMGKVFSPLTENEEPGLRKGERWRRRMRGALVDIEKSSCSSVATGNEPNEGLPRYAKSLYNLMLARSYYRLAGENCSDSRALKYAFEASKRVTEASLATSRESVLGNIYGCIALAYARGQNRELESICYSAEDCYGLAIEGHSRSSEGYQNCSFQHLRALNNKVDLTMKLANRKWEEGGKDSLGFLDNSVALHSLTEYSSGMIGCLGYERTPPEVTVTIAQAFGTLSQANSPIEDSRKQVFLERAGFFLATSALHAPDDFSGWEFRYFCGAVARRTSGLDEIFLRTFRGAALSQAITDDFSKRILAVCQ